MPVPHPDPLRIGDSRRGRHRDQTEWRMLSEAIPKMMDAIPTRATDGMAQIAGGTFRMGSDVHYPEERPAHRVTVHGFWIDRHAVTNADFAEFVTATGYVTFAERRLDPALYPGARPELLKPGSAVFRMSEALDAAARPARMVGVCARRRLAASRRTRQYKSPSGNASRLCISPSRTRSPTPPGSA